MKQEKKKYYVIENVRDGWTPISCASFETRERAEHALVACKACWPLDQYRLCIYERSSVVKTPNLK